MKRFTYIMDSMTLDEQTKPKLINSQRIARISKGSGTTKEDVKELIRYYNLMKKAIKGFKSRGMAKGPLAKMLRDFR